MVVVGERRQESLDHVDTACEVCELVRRHRLTLLEAVKFILHYHCTCMGEVKLGAGVRESLQYSALHYHNANSGWINNIGVREGVHFWLSESKLAASNTPVVAVPIDQL